MAMDAWHKLLASCVAFCAYTLVQRLAAELAQELLKKRARRLD